MATTVDQQQELLRVLGRLGIGVLELIASIRDEIVVLDRQRRAVAVLGDWPDESPRRRENLPGKTLGELFGSDAAAVHEAGYTRALRGEHVRFEWTRRKGRQLIRLSTTASPLRNSSSAIVGIVMITRHITRSGRDEAHVDASVAHKAKRLLELEHGIEQLAGAIDNYRSTGQIPREFRENSPLHQLSPRERQVLELLGQGYRPRSIAETLRVSPETVRNHLKAMFKKTGTHSQEELTAMLRASDGP
jgi:DNA-binding CsgD family transcriptional regulator